MSLRTTGYMQKYGGGSGGGGGLETNPDVSGPITRLFGKDKTIGGLQANPDGSLGFTPYQGQSGFLGAFSRGQANKLNAIYGPLIIKAQEELKQIAAQAEATKGIASSQQVGDVLKTMGIPDTPENRDHVAQSLSPLLIKNQSTLAGMQGNAMGAPGSQDAVTSNFQNIQLNPAVRNAASLAMNAPAGSTSSRPQVPGVDNGQPMVQSGALTSYQMAGGFPMKMQDGSIRMVGQQPLPTQQPGSVFIPRAGGNTVSPLTSNSNPNLSLDTNMNGFLATDSPPVNNLKPPSPMINPNPSGNDGSQWNGVIPNAFRNYIGYPASSAIQGLQGMGSDIWNYLMTGQQN